MLIIEPDKNGVKFTFKHYMEPDKILHEESFDRIDVIRMKNDLENILNSSHRFPPKLRKKLVEAGLV